LTDLRRQYCKWDIAGIVAFLALAPLLAYGVHEGLVAYAESGPREPSVHELRPSTVFWYAPAAILGCVLAGLAVHLLYRLALRGRGAEYQHYSNLSTGINASRMYLVVGLMLAMASLSLAWFAAQSRLCMTEHELIVRRIWSLHEERHPYNQITALKDIHERRKDRTIFVIRFADAEDWSTKVEVIFPGEAEKAYLSRRSGRPVERIEAE
jgi:hypothetical protein